MSPSFALATALIELATAVAVPPAEADELHAPLCGYRIVAVFPHDPTAYTQGLTVDDGDLFEGTGLYGDSSLRRVELVTGEVLQRHDLEASLFGEGIAIVGERIYQLTWLEHTGFVYDRSSFAEIYSFNYPREGWGLTFDGSHLVRSDGTATLEFWDPETLAPVRSLEVRDGPAAVPRLNELEFVAGEIFANVWLTDRVARIDPATGMVTTWLDLAGLLASQGGAPGAEVLNGVAWDARAQRLFVTGKRWPWLFEIALPDCPIGPIFRDGFESGDLSAWSPGP